MNVFLLVISGIVDVWVGTSGSGGLQFGQQTYLVQPSEAADNGDVVLSLQPSCPTDRAPMTSCTAWSAGMRMELSGSKYKQVWLRLIQNVNLANFS